MFEISWSELLILAVVTLLLVGKEELPVFLRTLGRYAGTMKRHAAEFRAHFDAAMREAELDAMRKEVDKLQDTINAEVMRGTKAADDIASGRDAAHAARGGAVSAAAGAAASEQGAGDTAAHPTGFPLRGYTAASTATNAPDATAVAVADAGARADDAPPLPATPRDAEPTPDR